MAHHRPGQLVHGLDGQAEIHHCADNRKHAVNADPVGHKIGCILGVDDSFSRHFLADFGQGVHHFGERVRSWNDLEEFHVPGRVEKMGDGEVFSKILGPAFTHGCRRDTGSVGRDDGVRLQDGFYFVENDLFNIQPFHNHFDDPVHISQSFKVILHVTDADELGIFRHIE